MALLFGIVSVQKLTHCNWFTNGNHAVVAQTFVLQICLMKSCENFDKPNRNHKVFGLLLTGNGTSIWHCFGPKANPLG